MRVVFLIFYIFFTFISNEAPAFGGVSGSLSEKIEIDRVSFSGVSLFSSEVIEGNLQLAPGDRLSRANVVATENRIQKLYSRKGYEQAKIESRLIRRKSQRGGYETILEFHIVEGLPTRVAEVEIVRSGQGDLESDRFFKESLEKFIAASGLKKGNVVDLEKLDEGRRLIQEVLASAEFIGGKVIDISIVATSMNFQNLSNQIKDFDLGTNRWVKIIINLDIGEKVLFGFRDNTVFTVGYLSALIAEQRLFGLGKDYVLSMKARIEDEYRSIGYADVLVTPFVYESNGQSRRVTYKIEEGPRVQIRSVQFDGISVFKSDELLDIFYSKGSTQLQHKFFIEKDIQKAAELLVESMKERGYLSARLVGMNSIRLAPVRSKRSIAHQNVVIYLYEGDQTLVRNVRFEGNQALSAEKIRQLLSVQEGFPLNLYAFATGIESIKKYYRSLGYLNMEIENEDLNNLVEYFQDNRVSDIFLKIQEGEQVRISSIVLEGVENTQENIVLREVTFKVGDILTQDLLEKTERNLRRLGIFSEVVLRTNEDISREGYRIVHLQVKEADRGILTYGPGYRYDLGIRAFGTFAYTNLWGLNHTVSLNLAANRRFSLYHFFEGQVQLAYSWPWFLIREMTFRPTLSVGRTQYINFSADTAIVSAGWEKQILGSPVLMGYFGYSLEYVNQFDALLLTDRQQMTLGSVTPRVSLDLRDSPLNPSSGYYALVWLDLASPVLGSQSSPFPIGYYRMQLRQDYYIPIFNGIVGYLSFRTGYEQSTTKTQSTNDPNSSVDAIPLIKQFTMGGIGSLRGYLEQELNFQKSNVTGSLTYVNYRGQIDLPLAGAFKFSLFLDAANLLQDVYSFSEGLRYGAGAGIRYGTPVGMVALDWGWKLNPGNLPDKYVIHFSVGVI